MRKRDINIGHVIALLSAGDLAVQLWRTEAAAQLAKDAYVARLRQFEARHGQVDGRLSPTNPDHAKIIAFSAAKREAMKLAKSKVYNIRRRLRAACQKAARLAAEPAGGAQ